MVEKKSVPVVNWNRRASQSLKKAYDYILQDSYTNAERVRGNIVSVVDSLPENPEKYPLDKYRKDNPGNYRAFELHS